MLRKWRVLRSRNLRDLRRGVVGCDTCLFMVARPVSYCCEDDLVSVFGVIRILTVRENYLVKDCLFNTTVST